MAMKTTERMLAILPRAAELLASGVSYTQAARILGVGYSSLRDHLPGRSRWTHVDGGRLGQAVKKRGRWDDRDPRQIILESPRSSEGCWLLDRRPSNQDGYGRLHVNGKQLAAHRVSYELFRGPIPEGMTIDHACHSESDCTGGRQCLHRRCVNPDHLRPMTLEENSALAWPARKPQCIHGHEYTAENTHLTPAGRRTCRQCRRDRAERERFARRHGVPIEEA